jgi:hypothetical protein
MTTKPPFPNPQPTIILPVTFTLLSDLDRYSGEQHMTMRMEGAEITDGEGKRVGAVENCLPLGLSFSVGGAEFVISDLQGLWMKLKEAYDGTH